MAKIIMGLTKQAAFASRDVITWLGESPSKLKLFRGSYDTISGWLCGFIIER
jgi:hypothetical protein